MEMIYDKVSDRVTTVLGFCELMLEDAYGSISPMQRRVLTDVVQAARELRDIVREAPPEYVHD